MAFDHEVKYNGAGESAGNFEEMYDIVRGSQIHDLTGAVKVLVVDGGWIDPCEKCPYSFVCKCEPRSAECKGVGELALKRLVERVDGAIKDACGGKLPEYTQEAVKRDYEAELKNKWQDAEKIMEGVGAIVNGKGGAPLTPEEVRRSQEVAAAVQESIKRAFGIDEGAGVGDGAGSVQQ